MREGMPAEGAVLATLADDPRRDWRRLAALDPAGGTDALTGAESVAAAASARSVAAAGNMPTCEAVLPALTARSRPSAARSANGRQARGG